MNDIKEYNKVSMEFSRVASNLLNSTYEDAHIYLYRFKKYIESTDIIIEIINEKIKEVDKSKNLLDKFIIDDDGWKEVNIPIDEEEHIKVIIDFLNYIDEKDIDIGSYALNFRNPSRVLNEICQSVLVDIFKPLMNYVNDMLKKEVIMMKEKDLGSINYNLNGAKGIAISNGNLNMNNSMNNSFNSSNDNQVSNILNEISLLKELIQKETSIEEDIKEDVVDDLDTVEEQLNLDEPKKIKISKAEKNIKRFIDNAPEQIGKTTKLIVTAKGLIEALHSFI